MELISVLLSVLGGILAIPVAMFALECLAAVVLPLRRARDDDAESTARLAILIPAHNEASVIRESVMSVMPQLIEGDRVLVVADNCTDNTASVAREVGAEVIERMDTNRRGKGYALDAGVAHLAVDPPEIVIFMDADCQMPEPSVRNLASAVKRFGVPVQGRCAMVWHQPTDARQQIIQFAWNVRDWVRPLGLYKLGGPCSLFGTGMAIGWPLLKEMELASGHLTEDMELAIRAASVGAAPRFCPAASVTTFFPESSDAHAVQRTRWEHGHLAMIVDHGLPAVLKAIRTLNWRLFLLAIDICVPPLALLCCLITTGLFAALIVWTTGPSLPIIIFAMLATVFGVVIGVTWYRFGRDDLALAAFLQVPRYVASKLGLYTRFLVRREREWVRTERAVDMNSPGPSK